MNLYCIARGFKIGYVHFPISHINYKGFNYLQKGVEHVDDVIERDFNDFFYTQ
jgi:hypothetical protein